MAPHKTNANSQQERAKSTIGSKTAQGILKVAALTDMVVYLPWKVSPKDAQRGARDKEDPLLVAESLNPMSFVLLRFYCFGPSEHQARVCDPDDDTPNVQSVDE